jgi:hypothetical protein
MSRAGALFGLAALLPLALQATPAQAEGRLAMPICGAQPGLVVLIKIGHEGPVPGDTDSESDCIKGCHAGAARKRGLIACFEPEQ